jgi:3-phenylpropionate/cinnamic acid dioxygenase small subunit
MQTGTSVIGASADTNESGGFDLPGDFGAGVPVPFADQRFELAREFVLKEAALLDNGRLREWLSLLHKDIRYRIPVRVTRWRADGPGYTNSMHMDETYGSLAGRVDRLDTAFAWGEDPPSRTRRFVTNMIVEQDLDDPQRLNVSSYLLVTRSRWDNPTYQLISAERRDILTRSGNSDLYRLISRYVLLDQSNLGTVNMALFL